MGIVGFAAGAASPSSSDRKGIRFILAALSRSDANLADNRKPWRCGFHASSAHLWLIEPWPFRGPLMRHGPLRRLADQPRILCERPRPMPRRARFPRLATRCKLGL